MKHALILNFKEGRGFIKPEVMIKCLQIQKKLFARFGMDYVVVTNRDLGEPNQILFDGFEAGCGYDSKPFGVKHLLENGYNDIVAHDHDAFFLTAEEPVYTTDCAFATGSGMGIDGILGGVQFWRKEALDLVKATIAHIKGGKSPTETQALRFVLSGNMERTTLLPLTWNCLCFPPKGLQVNVIHFRTQDKIHPSRLSLFDDELQADLKAISNQK